jgi:hypothetical protein
MHLCRFLVGLVLVVPLLAGPGRAADEDLLPGLTPQQEEIALFVLGNTVFAAYHVASEALIDDLDLPVLPASASILATILMIADEPDALRDELLLAAIDGWQLALDAQIDGRPLAGFWRRPGFDARRYAEAVCLIIGSDPAGFAEYARDRGLAEQRIEGCSQSFEGAQAGWLRLLDPHLIPEDSDGNGLHRIRLLLARALGFDDITEFLARTGVVADAMTDLASTIRLTRDLRLSFRSCGVAQTRWRPVSGEMTVCYELIRAAEQMIAEALANR